MDFWFCSHWSNERRELEVPEKFRKKKPRAE
jgi:hypothetical protein